MRAFIVGLLFIGLTSLCFAQDPDSELLSEVEVYVTNYNYLKSIKGNNVSPVVSSLERKAANFDIKSLSSHSDVYTVYKVSFFGPKGMIRAHYDNESNIISAREKFKNVKLPVPVMHAIMTKYPDCSISSDVYIVWYHHKKGATKEYKITLLNNNNNKNLKITTDENGTIL